MNVLDALQQLPGKVRAAETALWDAREELERLVLKAKGIENEATYWAAGNDESGKPRFSNADKRAAGADDKLSANTEYRETQGQIRKQRRAVASIENALGYYRDMQRNARVIALSRNPLDMVLEPEATGATEARA